MGYTNIISIMMSDKDKNEFEKLLSQYNYLNPERSIYYNKSRASVGYVYNWKWIKWNPIIHDYAQAIEDFVNTHDAVMGRLGEEIDIEYFNGTSEPFVPFYADNRIGIDDDWVDITSYIDTNTLTDDSPFIQMILDPIV